jgi:hypothetical protein
MANLPLQLIENGARCKIKPPCVMGVRSQAGSRAIDCEKTAQQGKIFSKSLNNGKLTNMNRPQSVTILAILQLLSAVFSLFDGLVILLFAGLFGGIGAALGGAKVGTVIGGAIALFAAISLIIGIASLILAWGLYELKSWAWMGTLIIHVIAALAQLAKMLGSAGTGANFLTLGFAVACIYYLLRPDVKQAFAI